MRRLALRCGITTDMGMIHKWVAFLFLNMFFLPSTPQSRLEDGGFIQARMCGSLILILDVLGGSD